MRPLLNSIGRGNWYIAIYAVVFLAAVVLVPAMVTRLPALLGLSAGYPEIRMGYVQLVFLPPPVRIISSLLYGNSFNLQAAWLNLRMDSYAYLPIEHSGIALILTNILYCVGLSIVTYRLLAALFKRRDRYLAFLSLLLSYVILFTAGVLVLILHTM